MPLNDDLQPDTLRSAFGRFPSGVAALCALIDGAPQGIVASSFTVGERPSEEEASGQLDTPDTPGGPATPPVVGPPCVCRAPGVRARGPGPGRTAGLSGW